MKRTYSEMKDSGVEWIGEIPKGWKIIRCKYISKFINGFAFSSQDLKKNYRYPVIRIGDIKTPSIDFRNCLGIDNNDSLSGYKIFKNDILMAMSGATAGKIGISDIQIDAYINQRVGIIRSNFPKFLFYCLLTGSFIEYILIMSESSAQPNISSTTYGNFYIPQTSPSEQTTIANYLDAKCAEIDSIISDAKNCIEEYRQWKSSVIFEAVTKGLDPNTEMKDSGVEWIGEIPKGWKVIKIKNVAYLKGRIGWQGLESQEYQEEGAFLITGTDFEGGNINWNNCVHISEQRYYEDRLLHIKENDLLITKDGTIGKLAIVKNCPKQVTLNSGVMYIRGNSAYKYLTKYLYYVLISEEFWEWYNASQRGNSTIKHLYQEQFYNFIFGYPSLSEQTSIANYLDEKCAQIDEVISEKEALILDLELYKKSLIYEVVTGKIKVS